MSRAGRLCVSALLLVAAPLVAQQQGEAAAATSAAAAVRPIIPASEYDRIEVVGQGELSPDGKWVAFEVARVSGGTELHYRAVGSDSEHVVPLGQKGEFSGNGRWLLYAISSDTTRAIRNQARRQRGPGGRLDMGGVADSTHDQVGIVELRSGATTVLADIESFELSADGAYVALRRYPVKDGGDHGSDLVVRDLERGSDLTFGNVREFAWSDDGALLAMAIDVGGKTGNGIQLLAAATGTVQSLDAGDQLYTGLAWRDHSRDLAVFRSRVDSAFADTSYSVIAWRELGSPRSSKKVYDFSADSAFPTASRVAAYSEPRWSADGEVLFFGIAARGPRRAGQEEPRATPGEQQKPAQVEVWHWKDLREYHQQNREGKRDRERTLLAAWTIGGNRVVPLADDYLADVQLADSGRSVIVSDENPYFNDIISGRPYRDVYAVDVSTGEREKVLTKVAYEPSTSPTGRYILYLHDGQWWSYDRVSRARADLTGKTGSVFVDMEDDHPVAERQPYGVAGWMAGEKAVLLADRFDLWQVNPDGTHAMRLTRGREDSTVYRLEDLDPDAHTIDPRRPIWLSATGEYSKKSGFARLTMGQPARRLLWLDKGVTELVRAKNADVFAYVVQSYEESPNLYVATGAFDDAKAVSHTNSFLEGFAWGKQELQSYTNSHGDTLQMMLTYPANYQPGTKYPMVVYYYEQLSQGFQRFVIPSERSIYNVTVFSQNGYFVLRPDIRFRARNPGFSGLDCVTSAVKAVLATGMVDPKRVGNMGHSWGGYQSAFYAVHGNGLFAATIAGAPLTNLISMYGYTSFNTGRAETGHFETGQERMEVPLWEDPEAYIRNSTVFAVDSLRTPLLLEEGDADGNVNYWQSMELYNFGRRLGKHVVMLLYNDENHGVARPESQRDYHTRQLEWFGHYLKGEPAADWITNGESYLARQKLLDDDAAARKRRPVASAPSAANGGRRAGGRAPDR
jgi:dipeptidyl aminopeptidase/acylaminoacyl peptidase